MPRKSVIEANTGRKNFSGFFDADVHDAIKSGAKVAGRTMSREINYRLARSVEADKARKRGGMRAAE